MQDEEMSWSVIIARARVNNSLLGDGIPTLSLWNNRREVLLSSFSRLQTEADQPTTRRHQERRRGSCLPTATADFSQCHLRSWRGTSQVLSMIRAWFLLTLFSKNLCIWNRVDFLEGEETRDECATCSSGAMRDSWWFASFRQKKPLR